MDTPRFICSCSSIRPRNEEGYLETNRFCLASFAVVPIVPDLKICFFCRARVVEPWFFKVRVEAVLEEKCTCSLPGRTTAVTASRTKLGVCPLRPINSYATTQLTLSQPFPQTKRVNEKPRDYVTAVRCFTKKGETHNASEQECAQHKRLLRVYTAVTTTMMPRHKQQQHSGGDEEREGVVGAISLWAFNFRLW